MTKNTAPKNAAKLKADQKRAVSAAQARTNAAKSKGKKR